MKIYFAGARKNHLSKLAKKPVLLSYAYNSAFWTEFRDMILDCGAFSTWKSGKEYDFDGYVEFCLLNGHLFEFVIAPDIIGGNEIENFDSVMRFQEKYQGKNTVPVFHEGEGLWQIQRFVDAGFSKVALGAIASRGKASIHQWLDSVFKMYPPESGIKFHGLGMNQKTTLVYYADFFDTVDSTTWLAFNKYGIDANKYLLNDRSNEFLLNLGISVLEDLQLQSDCPKVKQTQKEVVAVTTAKTFLDLIEEMA